MKNDHTARLLLTIAVVLGVPILPFLWFGRAAESQITEWLHCSCDPGTAATLVIGLLAVDVLLPVPSSAVNVFAGKMLGFWAGTAVSWCGMTAGALLVFALVRMLGRPLARWLSTEEVLNHMEILARRYGILLLILARPVPVFAEASVLLAGIMQLGWQRFLFAVGLSNLGIAAAYAALGDLVQLPIALAASIAIPLVFAAIAKRFWPVST